MLVLGVGLNTAVFTFVNAAMIQPFPYPEPERVVSVFELKEGRTPSLGWPLTAANLVDLRSESRSLELISASSAFSVELAGDEPVRLAADRVLTDYFQVLGVPALLGRVFQREDYDPSQVALVYRFRGPPDGRFVSGLSDRVILSYELWQRRFAGDPDVVGRPVTLDGGNATIVGVMPRGFQPVSSQIRVDVWLPEVIHPDGWSNRSNHRLTTVARIRDGVSAKEATAEIGAIFRRLERQYPFTNEGWSAHVVPLGESTLGDTRKVLPLLLVGAGVVLLVACGNVASLLLARASRRKREIATRVALGASLLRIVRQLLVESAMLGLASGLLSLAVASLGVYLFSDVRLATELPFVFEPRVDANVLGFALLVSLIMSFVFGLAPAAHAARVGRGGVSGFAWQSRGTLDTAERGGRWLVASQIAMTMVLLAVGGLMLRSLMNLGRVELGFQPQRLLAMTLKLPPSRYEGGEAIRQFGDRLLENVRNLSGIESAALASEVPFGGVRPNFPFAIEGREGTRDSFNAMAVVASDDFFHVMGVPLLRGRAFDRRDGVDQPWVVVIDETMAEQYWSGEDPIGKRIRFAGAPKASSIVGIVGSVKYDDLQAGAERQLYVPHHQLSQPELFLLVRTERSPLEAAVVVRERVRALDSRLPLYDVRTVTSLAQDSLELPRFRASLLGLYAVVALVIAAGGLFALLLISVTQRTSELGVRMALGADSADILRLIVGGGMKLALVGTLAGLGATVVVSRYVSSLLFGVSPTDPAILTTTASILLGAAFIASYLPARRATRADLTVALRHE